MVWPELAQLMQALCIQYPIMRAGYLILSEHKAVPLTGESALMLKAATVLYKFIMIVSSSMNTI
jgi:hypothetical protein